MNYLTKLKQYRCMKSSGILRYIRCHESPKRILVVSYLLRLNVLMIALMHFASDLITLIFKTIIFLIISL